MRFFFSICITVFFLLPPQSKAQDITDPTPPKALQDIVETGAQIFYLGTFEGMKGWALIRQGKPEFFYENREGTAMVMGLLFNKSGEMITTGQLSSLNRKVGPSMFAATNNNIASKLQTDRNDVKNASNEERRQLDAPLSSAQKMFVELIGANWITINPDGANDIFAFIDPDCPHCKQMLQEMAPLFEENVIRLRVIPVGITPASQRKAALLLASGNPEERLLEYASGNEQALDAPENTNTDAVEKNNQLLLKWGFDLTPTVIYRTNGEQVRIVRGRPTDYQILISDLINN